MAYAAITDVQALCPQRPTYSSTTKPTSTQVEGFITSIASEIDTALAGRGLTVPVTTPAEFLAYVTHINALGAASLAERAMFPAAVGPGATPSSAVLWKQYQDGLKYLKEGKVPTSLDGSDVPFSYHEQRQGTEEEPTENYPWQDPKFKKNKEF